MTVPGSDPGQERDPFAPPKPGDPPPPQRYPSPQRSRRTEILLKVLAGVAVVLVLGFVSAAALFVYAMSTYGDNK